MKILAIETSCDETSIAIIYASGSIKNPHIQVLAHNTSSQIKIHREFGGVVPNLASREHQKNLVPILVKSLKEAGFLNLKSQKSNHKSRFYRGSSTRSGQVQKHKSQNVEKILNREQELFARIREYVFALGKPRIDTIAVTVGPGLEPALWVGINFARALGELWDIPIIPINHMEGHIYSALLRQSGVKSKSQKSKPKQIPNYKFQMPKFPAIALLVSGGHTELVLIKKIGAYKVIGETLDDAAGEAFDKTARLLGLAYPGGPEIARYAQKPGKKIPVSLPRPMLNSKDLNFSFSGLKTAALYLVQKLQKTYAIQDIRPAVAQEFQNAVTEVLVSKTISAAKKYKAETILLGGGVSANKQLRDNLGKETKKQNIPFSISPLELTGDNALMIAVAGFFNKKNMVKNTASLRAEGQLRIS